MSTSSLSRDGTDSPKKKKKEKGLREQKKVNEKDREEA
jgi:hypothetical protein